MRNGAQLERRLLSIDGRGYKSYKSIAGSYLMDGFCLHLDYIQGDPFASPSRIRVQVESGRAGFPPSTYETPERKTALEDYLTRRLDQGLRAVSGRLRGTGESGLMAVDTPGQEVLKRTSMVVGPEGVEARMVVGLPARGRRVMGPEARDMLFSLLPPVIKESLLYTSLEERHLARHLATVQDQVYLRHLLKEKNLVGFLGEGSLLPRRSGISDLPMRNAVALEVDPALSVSLETPNSGLLAGLGIPRGVTLIVGGGYHGKSTLLRALERGIYQHVPGDGRDRVVTDPTAVKIRAEDGRRVEGIDISPFISNLPSSQETSFFSSEAASGSTSQAANIMEAVEMGARCLLIDEDTSATNFMIRDARMQALVDKSREPITPFIDRVRDLWENMGISSVIVVGGSGDYLDVADTVIMMQAYRPVDVTAQARKVAGEIPTTRRREVPLPMERPRGRCPVQESFNPYKGKRARIRAHGVDQIEFGTQRIDMSAVEQLVDPSQARAIGQIIHLLARGSWDGKTSLREGLGSFMKELEAAGLDSLSPYTGHPGDFAEVRDLEVAAAINRLRSLRVRP